LGVVWVGVPIFSLVDGVEGGNKFFSPILPIFDPADGGDSLCSVAPPEVSGLPVFAVGGVDSDEGSAETAAEWEAKFKPKTEH
jgi:hypothetical protein